MRRIKLTLDSRRVMICSFLALFLISVTPVFAQEDVNKWRGREGRALKYAIIEESDLGDGVRKIIFSQKTDDQPSSPKLIETLVGEKDERQIKLLRGISKETLMSPVSNLSIEYSRYGDFYITKETTERHSKTSRTMKAKLFNTNGQLFWEKEYVILYDAGEPIFTISEEGIVVELDLSSAKATFYSKSGNKIKEYDSTELSSPDKLQYWKGISGTFSDNGEYFVANDLYDVYGIKKEFSGSSMFFFDKHGQLLWKYNADETATDINIWPSKEAQYVINYHYDYDYTRGTQVGIQKTLYLLSREGRLITKYHDLISSEVAYSEDQKYVVISDGSQVFLIDCDSGERILRYSVLGSRRRILGIDISGELEVVGILEGEHQFATSQNNGAKVLNGKVVVLNYNRVPAWELDLPDVEAPKSISTHLSMSGNGEKMSVNLGSKFWVLGLQE